MGRPAAEIKGLTGLRWLAALLVYLLHVRTHLPAGPGGCLQAACKVGWSGVPIFFALSGFLLTRLYFEKFRDGVRWGDFRSYFLKRVARIYPLYYFLLLTAIADLAWNPRRTATPPGGWDVASHLVMLHGYFGTYAPSILPPAWSLTVEESFYLLLPLICLALGRASRAGGGGVRPVRFALALLALNAVTLGGGFALDRLLGQPRNFFLNWVNMTVVGQLPTFSLGILAGTFVWACPDHPLLCSRGWSNAVGAAAVALFAAAAWYFADRDTWMEGFTGQAFFAPSAALMLLSLCGRSAFAWLLGQPLLVYGGRISYAFYLMHAHPAFYDLIGRHLSDPLLLYVIYSGISAALYQLVEKPAHGWLRRRWAAG